LLGQRRRCEARRNDQAMPRSGNAAALEHWEGTSCRYAVAGAKAGSNEAAAEVDDTRVPRGGDGFCAEPVSLIAEGEGGADAAEGQVPPFDRP
jgi:hypothetical protein